MEYLTKREQEVVEAHLDWAKEKDDVPAKIPARFRTIMDLRKSLEDVRNRIKKFLAEEKQRLDNQQKDKLESILEAIQNEKN